jgi:hypothetical protein
MDQDATTLYQYNSEVHCWNYNQLYELEQRIRKCADLEELADYGYALKKVADMLDDTRKTANKASELAQQIQCHLQTSLGAIGPVRTQHCTATPDVKFQTPIPKKETDPEAYYAICELAGVSKDAADKEMVRPHWPGVTEMLTELAKAGKPFPAGINPEKIKPVYKVTYRKKSDSPF